MRARTHERRSEPHVPAIVVTYLGRIAWSTAMIAGLLVWRLIETTAKAKVSPDAAVVGAVISFIAVATGCTTALGAILASVRNSNAPTPGEPGAVPLDVNVKNTEKEPVPTDPQPPAPPAPAPDEKPPGVPAADFPSGDSIDSDAVTDPGAPA